MPGPLGSSASVGTNALIAEGLATALVSGDQLVRAAGVTMAARPAGHVDPLLDLLRDGPLGVDEIARRTRVPLGTLSSRLAALMMSGKIEGLADGRIARVERP